MAPETKTTKRKGAENASTATKKRKSEKPAAEPTKTESAKSKQTKDTTKSIRPSRKRAADFFENEEASKTAAAPAVKEPKAKKTKVADGSLAGKSASAKLAKATSKATPVTEPEQKAVEEAEEDVWADSEEDDIADQSAALLQGFESSDDEGDHADAIAEVPAIPSDQKLSKQLKAASKNEQEGPGVVYVGRVPHGFYEHQMRAYFSQFGDISRLRLSRNKKTGHSKHYAFIEFSSREVAKIVAATMNKYLLFGHILQVRTLAPEEVHPELFKGANKRFKAVPRNKIQGRQLRLPKEREVWEKRIANENKRRKEKEEKLKTLGYTYEAPDLVSTKAIPFRKQSAEDGGVPDAIAESDIPKALPAPEAKKSKAKKSKQAGAAPEGSDATGTPAATKTQQKKAKSLKAKKELAAAA